MSKPFRAMTILVTAAVLMSPLSTGQAFASNRPSDEKASSADALEARVSPIVLSSSPSRHGPQRTTYEQGIPRHAYSPFDKVEEAACPPGGCDSQPGVLLVKLAPQVRVQASDKGIQLANATSLNGLLDKYHVSHVEAIFPRAKPPVGGVRLDGIEPPQPVPDLTRWLKVQMPDDKAALDAAIEALQADPNVAAAEPDYLRKPVGAMQDEVATGGLASPSLPLFPSPESLPGPGTDPLYSQQWHLNATNVPAAWQWLEDNGYAPGGGRDIVVAVIDTGVDYTHPDLAANMWVNPPEFGGTPGVDDDGNGYVDDIYGADTVTPDGDPQDDHGHGTHVAGIIAAQADNGIGGVGVAYNVQVMALKAAQYSGMLASSDIAEAIYYAVEKSADVINMSFGGYARSQVEEDALAVAFGQAVLVAAAGNDGKVNLPCPFGQDMYPAAYNWVLGVMASTSGGGRAGFSNFDCIAHDSHEYELMAPGVDVWSTLPLAQYAAWDGTSMATPIVSGIAALLRTKWWDKDVYSSRFIMGQIASNASPVADAYTALTVAPQPELSYLEHWLFDTEEQSAFNDGDGIVDAGETIDLAIVIRNHWGKADPVTVLLEAWAEGAVFPDPYVTMITDTVDYGAVGSFNIDDNGLIYEADVIVGVQHPFRFSVDPNTPNDHVIPFRLTMTAGNGYDPGDPAAPYVFQSRFYLIVQRGTELPTIISEDMVLTKDYYWLLPDATLIEAGVAVTVTEGTQIQFWSIDPDDPYAGDPQAYLQVEGSFITQGTLDEPVELLSGAMCEGCIIEMYEQSGGRIELHYTFLYNPVLSAGVIDHARLAQMVDCLCYSYGDCQCRRPETYADQVSYSIFDKLGWGSYDSSSLHLGSMTGFDTNLFDSSITYLSTTNGHNNVFLRNYRRIGSQYWVARAVGMGYSCYQCSEEFGRANNEFTGNAILNAWWDPNINHWMQFDTGPGDRDVSYFVNDNFWNTTSSMILDAAIVDYHDDFNRPLCIYQPVLTIPLTTTYPFVSDIILSTTTDPDASVVGAEPVTFTATFNRDMDTNVQPAVSFGPDVPETDYTVHAIEGGWTDPRTWQGTFSITPVTGDGYQFMRIAGAVAADDPWLVTGDDSERFRFEIITSGSEAMNLQATGGEGYVDLMWTQNDFDLLAGFNLYRSTTITGTAYTRINSSIIPPDVRAYQDADVQPGQPYYYKFTVVKSDMTESGFSNVADGTPVDTIPPVISHTPVTEASPGLPLTLFADVTDNVAVQAVTLYYRHIGATQYTSKAMVHTTGNRYSATIAGSHMSSPGIEYYIEATDGVSTVRQGRPDYPYQVTVEDRPVVTNVNPNHGPTDGGTEVTVSGSNFKAGATVTFGGAVAGDVTVLSSSQITCTTPPHFPETVDVTVVNTDTQSGTLLRAFTYQSPAAQLSLPDTGGEQMAIVQVPLNAANLQGLAAADLTITFDPAVLDAQGANTGNLTPGWSMVANTSTPGELRLSMASGGGTVSGSGTLTHLEFEVVGSPGMSTTLHIASASLNDGAIPVETTDGSFAVNLVYDISGTVHFWEDSAGVPGVLLALEGDRVYTGLSGTDGSYIVSSAPAADYTLTPSKADDANGISAYDASFVLQHSAGLITLSGHQVTAADVNKSGAITSMDAFYILQKAVDLITLPFPGAGVVWDFDPQTRSYANLNQDQTGQDFTAVLLGDVSGNWTASGLQRAPNPTQMPGIAGGRTLTATLSLPQVSVLPGQQVTVPLTLTLPEGEVYGADITVTYDPAVVSATQVLKGALATGWSMASNLTIPGVIQVAMAGATPIHAGGELLLLVFEAGGSAGTETDLALTQGDLNEGGIPTELEHGHLRIAVPVQAGFTAAPTSGPALLTVVFTNTSTGDYTSNLWTFGDGGISAMESPTHTYTAAGVYTVSLTVDGPGGVDTETKTAYVHVSVLSVAGAVEYWEGDVAVPGTLLRLEGDHSYNSTNGANGTYALTGILAGDYILTPSKSDDVQGISAYDASFVLRHTAGLLTLTGYQATAADVNQSGVISSQDASYILLKAVDLIPVPFPGASVVWDFDPQQRSYTNLDGDQADQDFAAILLGDVSGNWPVAGAQQFTASSGSPVIMRVQGGIPNASGIATATALVEPGGTPIYSLDLLLSYDPDFATPLTASSAHLAEGWMVSANLAQAGLARLALAGAVPLSANGELLTITFRVASSPGTRTELRWTRGNINEGQVPVELVDGWLGAWQVYLPLTMRKQ